MEALLQPDIRVNKFKGGGEEVLTCRFCCSSTTCALRTSKASALLLPDRIRALWAWGVKACRSPRPPAVAAQMHCQ